MLQDKYSNDIIYRMWEAIILAGNYAENIAMKSRSLGLLKVNGKVDKYYNSRNKK